MCCSIETWCIIKIDIGTLHKLCIDVNNLGIVLN